MSGWKKLDVKDLNLDIEDTDSAPDKGSKKSNAIDTFEEIYDFRALNPQASSRSNLDPLRIWEAYKKCRDAKSKVPAEKMPVWILEYFDTVADKLVNTRTDVDVRELCRSALNISKKDLTRFRKSEKPGRGVEIAQRVVELRDQRLKKKNRARVKLAKVFAEVAHEFSCSEAEVRGSFEKFCKKSEMHDGSLGKNSNKGEKESGKKKPEKEKSKRQKK